MSKWKGESGMAFERIAEGLNEALLVARGKARPARLHEPAESLLSRISELAVLIERHRYSRSAARAMLVDAVDVYLDGLPGRPNARATHPCKQCGHLFEVGAGAKRSIAKFCSDACRMRFDYEKRRAVG